MGGHSSRSCTSYEKLPTPPVPKIVSTSWVYDDIAKELAIELTFDIPMNQTILAGAAQYAVKDISGMYGNIASIAWLSGTKLKITLNEVFPPDPPVTLDYTHLPTSIQSLQGKLLEDFANLLIEEV